MKWPKRPKRRGAGNPDTAANIADRTSPPVVDQTPPIVQPTRNHGDGSETPTVHSLDDSTERRSVPGEKRLNQDNTVKIALIVAVTIIVLFLVMAGVLAAVLWHTNHHSSSTPTPTPSSTPTPAPKEDPFSSQHRSTDGEVCQLKEMGSQMLGLIRIGAPIATITDNVQQCPDLKDFRDVDDRTPLHNAACFGNLEATKYLLSVGANRDSEDEHNYRPIDDALGEHCKKDLTREQLANQEVIALLLESGDPRISDFLFKCSSGSIDAIRGHLREHPNDLTEPDFDLRTCFHIAAKEGNMKVLEYIVGEAGDRDIFTADRWSQTPLDVAVQKGHDDVAAYLKSLRRTGQKMKEITYNSE